MKTKLTLLSSIALGTLLLTSSLLAGPVFANSSSSASRPLATGAHIAAATPAYNSSLDWTQYTGPGQYGFQGADYSPQNQINSGNVNQLQITYIAPLPSALSSSVPFNSRFKGFTYQPTLEGTGSSILTQNGTGFALTDYMDIYGFDLSTGALLQTPPACSITGPNVSISKCKLGAPGAMYAAFDWSAISKNPVFSGSPGHVHNFNIINGVAWVPGWGCEIQGWQVATGKLVANLTGMCDNVPGNVHPLAGLGQTYALNDGSIQVDQKNNAIVYWAAADSEGTKGFRFEVYACSLSAALAGQNCVANGGDCTTIQGGACSSGSTMLWRTFLMPPDDGSLPNWATNLCPRTWVGGVPCSAMDPNLIKVDSARPDLAARWNGSTIAPNTGCSEVWGHETVDAADGLIFLGTGDTGPDWNSTLRMGPTLACNAVVALHINNGTIAWINKDEAKDVDDRDCNLNQNFGVVNGTPEVMKTCKGGKIWAMNAQTGQPLWLLDPAMPDYHTLGPNASPLSKALVCQPNNATSCDTGKVWDKIYSMFKQNITYPNSYISGTFKEAGSNPHPHGYITPGPTRAMNALDPLNATEMGSCSGLTLGSNGKWTATSCNPGFVCPVGSQATCAAQAAVGKAGFYERRYLSQTEDAFDPTTGTYYSIVMSGPAEHDWIGNVDTRGRAGLVGGTNLYFGGQQATNSTLLAINAQNGNVLWNYTRPIYYRGGIVATGGMIISAWPDGHLVFNDEKTGAVLRDINVGVPLVVPLAIAPDKQGNEHIMLSYGGTNHGILGMPGLHGPLGHGYVTPGAVISYSLGPAPTGGQQTTVTSTTTVGSGGVVSTITQTITGQGGSQATTTSTTTVQNTTGVSDIAFYGAVGVAVILAIVAGALALTRRRPSA